MFGSSGTSGINGSEGSGGSGGTSGTSGTNAPGFSSGTSGTSGISGTDGSAGTSGTNAPGFSSGTSGTSGQTGTSGTSGTNAPGFSSGTSGVSGTSGTSGSGGTSATGVTSGTSGTNGFALNGSTNNGLLTYQDSPVQANIESNLTYDGSTLTIVGNTTQTGDITLTGGLDASTYLEATAYREIYNNLGTGASTPIDCSTANNFRRQFNGTATVTFTNVPVGKAFGFTLLTVNAGAFVITWPATVNWAGGIQPVLTSSGEDVLVFYTFDGGTSWYGFTIAKNLS
jgi:hypothetical protein